MGEDLSSTFEYQNKQIGLSFLEHTIFRGWKTNFHQSWKNLELFIGGKCNLACKYCYLHKYGDQLFPKYLDDSTTIKNLELVCDWLLENAYYPDIEIFSGEPLINEKGFIAIDLVLDKFANKYPGMKLTIPTNMTFLLNDMLTSKVEELYVKAAQGNVKLLLSASVDGKYCGVNRPMKNGLEYNTDEFYDKVFAFIKKHGLGLHPMVYSENIELWPANFLWFQEMLNKFQIDWTNLYLLEVRNYNWSIQEVILFEKFIDFLIRWTFKQCNSNVDEYIKFMFGHSHGFNILGSPLSSVDRGIGCSIQSTLVLRVGDLAIFPCHRLSYPIFKLGHFITQENRISGLEIDNVEMLIVKHTFEGRTMPICESCLIKDLCSLGCLGSQFEVTGDLFSPIPTVCRLEHGKIIAMIRTYKDLDIYDDVMSRISKAKKYAMEELYVLRGNKETSIGISN